MAKYTTQLKTIIEEINGLTSPASATQMPALIEYARPKLFNFAYTMNDTAHQQELERKILQHYLFREIGFETVGLWHLKLMYKMQEIMPYYNELYKSAKLDFDPLTNYNYDETANATSNSTSNSKADTTLKANQNVVANQNTTANNETNSKANSSQTDVRKDTNAFSDTPQSSLSGVESLTYLTEARIISTDDTVDTDQTGQTSSTDSSDTKQNSDTTQTSDTNYTNSLTSGNISANTINRKGYQGVNPSELLMKYRDTILNIDMMVIDALADLFMLIY